MKNAPYALTVHTFTQNKDNDYAMDHYLQSFWIKLLLYLAHYIDSRISINGQHSSQVAEWVKNTALKMNCDEDETRQIYWAALLHDIGKIGVPDTVLSKPGPLTEEEWDVMKLHPTVGSNIVQSLKPISHIAPVIYSHQEKYDGTGYPEGLRGEQIPLGARILTVVDAYDAMTSNRRYRRSRSHQEAVNELRQQRGKHFDPKVVEAFLEVIPASANTAIWN